MVNNLITFPTKNRPLAKYISLEPIWQEKLLCPPFDFKIEAFALNIQISKLVLALPFWKRF